MKMKRTKSWGEIMAQKKGPQKKPKGGKKKGGGKKKKKGEKSGSSTKGGGKDEEESDERGRGRRRWPLSEDRLRQNCDDEMGMKIDVLRTLLSWKRSCRKTSNGCLGERFYFGNVGGEKRPRGVWDFWFVGDDRVHLE